MSGGFPKALKSSTSLITLLNPNICSTSLPKSYNLTTYFTSDQVKGPGPVVREGNSSLCIWDSFPSHPSRDKKPHDIITQGAVVLLLSLSVDTVVVRMPRGLLWFRPSSSRAMRCSAYSVVVAQHGLAVILRALLHKYIYVTDEDDCNCCLLVFKGSHSKYSQGYLQLHKKGPMQEHSV